MIALAWLSLVSAPAQAAPMSLTDAMARAEAASMEIQLQQLAVDSKNWLADPQAGDPSLRVAVRDLGQSGVPLRTVTRLRFPLPRPWDLATAMRESRSSQARESAELDRRTADLRHVVRSLYHQVTLLREVVEQAAALAEIRRTHLDMVQQRRTEGLSTALEWLESEEARRDADADRADLLQRLRETEAELRLMCNLPSTDPLELVPEGLPANIDTMALAPDVALVGRLDEVPSVREAQARVVREEARLKRSRLRGLPWIDWVQAGVELEPVLSQAQPLGQPPAQQPLFQPPTFEIGGAIDIPLYQWGRKRTRPDVIALESAQLALHNEQQQAQDRVVRRMRDFDAARERHAVAVVHRDGLREESVPILEVADPLLKVELQARNARAGLREAIAVADLMLQLDQYLSEVDFKSDEPERRE